MSNLEDKKEALQKLRQEQFLNAKLSEQVRMAVEDMDIVRKNPKYRFEMDNWVDTRKTASGKKVCFVCVAGAVMANRFGIADYASVPSLDTGDCRPSRSFSALNAVRAGYIEYAKNLCSQKSSDWVLTQELGGLNDFTGQKYHAARAELLRRADILEAAGY